MIDLNALRAEFSNCDCKREHELTIKDVVIGSGITKDTGKILLRNGFGKKLLLVADKNTIKAADGVIASLKDFELTLRLYEDLREATVKEMNIIKDLLLENDGVISVGTGSLNDICRKAAAEAKKDLCIFATAASMDGFASNSAPLTDENFKISYQAKSPEVIIADTKILAAAPSQLKSAGFGDMVGKYVGLVDWQVSAIVSGEYYCEKVAGLTRMATDRIMALCDRITADDEESAAAVFEALLLTGIGMGFTKTSRPASGTEHILSHFWECKKLLEGKRSDFHGKKVGVATLLISKIYADIYKMEKITAKKEEIDWEDVYKHYGELKEEVIKLNTPDTITDHVDIKILQEKWQEIRKIIASVPTYEQIKEAMIKAGAATTASQIGVSETLKEEGLKYHPYMRRRLSLLRLSYMIEKNA